MKRDSKRGRVKKKVSRVQNILTLTVLDMIKKDYYAKQIADKLKMTKSAIHYHIKKLLKARYIEKDVYSSMRTYKITGLGETALKRTGVQTLSYSTTTESKDVHDLYIKIPIIHRGVATKAFWDKVNDQFRNSKQYHRHFEEIGASIRETTKHICIQLQPRSIDNYDQVYGLISGAIGFVLGKFTAMGYVLDYMHPKVKGVHLSFGDEKSRELLRKKLRVRVGLGRDRHKFFQGDPAQPASVWLDTTPNDNWETNDYEHAKLRALEPENVARMVQLMEVQNENLATYATHLNAHIPVLKGMSKLLKKLNAKMSQRKLSEFNI